MYRWASCDQHRQRNPSATRAFARPFIGKIMSNKNLADQISEIDENIYQLQCRCEGNISHSETKKINKTIKSLRKSRLKLHKKLSKDRNEHDQIT